MNKKFERLILTMFGVGYFSFFPGTIASLLTGIFFYFFWIFIGLKDYQLLIYITLVLIFIYSSYVINKHYNNKDAQEIVIDEFVGQSIPIMSFYYLNNLKILTIFSDLFDGKIFEIWIILSFLLFRFFDILKIFPINLVDKKIKNGFGVMLDDVIAGVFATISLYIIILWI